MDSVVFSTKVTPNHLVELNPWFVLENPNSDLWFDEACFYLKRLLDPRILLLHLVVKSGITPNLPPNKDPFQRLSGRRRRHVPCCVDSLEFSENRRDLLQNDTRLP